MQFDELSGTNVHEILAVRQSVFVVEQQCPYQDADGFDQTSWHLLGHNLESQLLAYARINFPGTRYHEPSFGRVLTTRAARGCGLGRQVVEQCILKCTEEYAGMTIRISAQTYLTRFYESFGFESVGQPYDEDGIEHIDMVLYTLEGYQLKGGN